MCHTVPCCASRIPSKFDLRRFCRATGATALVAVQAPTPDELGFAKELTVEEVRALLPPRAPLRIPKQLQRGNRWF